MCWHKVTTNKCYKEPKFFSANRRRSIAGIFDADGLFQGINAGKIAKLHSITELAHMLIVENALVSSGIADIVTALLLFLTLPVTVAPAERSFWKLNIIKNYLRNTIWQTRLRVLSLLAIKEHELIERFAETKARKIKLNWQFWLETRDDLLQQCDRTSEWVIRWCESRDGTIRSINTVIKITYISFLFVGGMA